METNYYIIDGTYKDFARGSLFKYDKSNITYIQKDIIMPFKGNIPNNWLPISQSEAHYLKEKPINQRFYAMKSKKAEIESFVPNDKCKIRNDSIVYTFIKKQTKSDGLYFVLEHNSEEKTVPAYEIILLDKDNNEYYLLTENYLEYDKGSLIVIKEENLLLYDDMKKIEGSPECIKHIVKQLSKSDAHYLSQISIQQRIPEMFIIENQRVQIRSENALDNFQNTMNYVDELINIDEPFGNVFHQLESLNSTASKHSEIEILLTVTINLCNKSKFEDKAYQDCMIICLRIISERCNETTVVTIKECNNLLSAMKNLFIFIGLKEELSPSDEILLEYIICVYYLKYGQTLDSEIIDGLEKCYKRFVSRLKLMSGLCLSYGGISDLYEDIKSFLIKDCMDITFMDEDVLTWFDITSALGNMATNLHQSEIVLTSTVNNSLKDISKCDDNNLFTDENKTNLELIYDGLSKFSEDFTKILENDEFIDVANRFMRLFLELVNETANNSLMNDCVKTILIILRALSQCIEIFSKKIFNCKSFMGALNDVFKKLVECGYHDNRELIEEIMGLYWNIHKQGILPEEESLIECLETCFSSEHSASTFKTTTALCLSLVGTSVSRVSEQVQSYLQNLLVDHTTDQIHGFFTCELYAAIGRVLVFKKSFNPSKFDQLMNNLHAIYESTVSSENDQFTSDTHKNLKFIYENISKINADSIKFYTSNELINKIQFIMERFQSFLVPKKKLEIKDKIFLDCVMTTLSIVCDLCDSDKSKKMFITNITNNSNLIHSLKDIFRSLLDMSQPRSLEENFLELVVFIFWNVLRSEMTNCFDDIAVKIFDCYKKKVNNQIKLVTAMCISSMDCVSSSLNTDAKLYLEDLLRKDTSCHIYGFSRTEVLSGLALGYLQRKQDDNTKSVCEDNETFSGSIKDNISKTEISSKNLNTKITIPNTDSTITNDMKISDIDEFYNILEKGIKILLNKKKKISETEKNDLEKVKNILNQMIHLSDKSVVTAIVNYNTFMHKLKEYFFLLVKKNVSLLLKEHCDILIQILTIYGIILKCDLKLESALLQKFEDCFYNNNSNDHIKLAAAFCLTFTPNFEPEKINSLKDYFEVLCRASSKDDINGFPRSDILMCLGSISLMNRKRDLESQSSIESLQIGQSSGFSSLKAQSISDSTSENDSVCTNKPEDLNEFIENIIPSIQNNSIASIKSAIKINNIRAVKHCIINVDRTIELHKHKDIWEFCSNDSDLLVKLLDKSTVAPILYQDLILLLPRFTDSVKLICEKIGKGKISSNDNQLLLGRAFCFAKENRMNLCSEVIRFCNNCDDFLRFSNVDNPTETFLTKMLQEFSIQQIESVWQITKFNTNCRNKDDEAPIVIAARTNDKLEWLLNNITNDLLQEDLDLSLKAAISNEDVNIRHINVDLLYKNKP